LIYNFENYSLDVDRQELRRAGNLVVIEPQVLDLLQYLIRNRQRIVSKDDLIANVWNGRIVSDSTVTSRITSARQAIGDSGNRQRLIRTVARKGIRFVGEIEENLGSRDAHAVGQVPDKPSIAVLPFQNMSGDPAQEYFGDGITEDITTALSRLRWFFVIARNSSFAYKGKVIDVRAIARELGVRYVLEGSVRKGGGRVYARRSPDFTPRVPTIC
jgi:DNA-binding winged helix-turn-helix (wHTH) protein